MSSNRFPQDEGTNVPFTWEQNAVTNKPQHSPEPWTVSRDVEGKTVIIADGYDIATVYSVNRKDAPLMAAAPALLAMCKEAMSWKNLNYAQVELLRRTIARAEGRQP